MNHIITNPKVRAYIYGVLVAAGAVALVYGLVNVEQLGVWLALGGAVLGLSNGLALANTPTPGKHEAAPVMNFTINESADPKATADQAARRVNGLEL